MKKRSHAYIALMALKLIDDETKGSRTKWRRQARKLAELLFFYLPEVYEGAWLPDSVIVDLKTGHIFKMGATSAETDVASIGQEFRVPYSVLDRKLVGKRLVLEHAKKSPVLSVAYRSNPIHGGELPNRVLALSHSIGDQLKLTDYPMAFYSKPERKRGFARAQQAPGGLSGVTVGTLSIAPTYSARQIALSCFMLAHYIADAHMPIHCDMREFKHPTLGMRFHEKFHDRMEKYWEEQVPDKMTLLTIDTRSLDDTLAALPQGSMFSRLGQGNFRLSLNRLRRDEWNEMVDVCRVSFAVSRKWIPDRAQNVADIQNHRTSAHSATEDFDTLSLAIFHDSIEAVARIWLKAWLRYVT